MSNLFHWSQLLKGDRTLRTLFSTLCLSVTISLSSQLSSPAHAKTLSEKILGMEQRLEHEFETYFDADLAEVTQSPEEIAQTLQQLAEETGSKSAVIWAIPQEDHLHLVLITPSGEPIVSDLYDVPETLLRQTVQDFYSEIHGSPENMRAARQLHAWLLDSFETDHLKAEDIDTLLFCLGKGLRGLPLSALHDGEQFLIEKYALTRIPAFNLIQTEYSPIDTGQLLAMGASEFEVLAPLPAVPTELTNIFASWRLNTTAPMTRSGVSLLNPRFTIANLQQQIARRSPTVVHLATHAEFKNGTPENSYIQLWDSQLTLNDIRDINWQNSDQNSGIELLVLSACQTALGNDEAELGFAGITLQSGVKSAVASLWNVSDTGTLTLMSEFYEQLGSTNTKAQALRQAQLKMLRGEVSLENDRLNLSRGSLNIGEGWSQEDASNLSSPYYWSAFTMVGSPW